MDLSVVVPVYNGGDFLAPLLLSLEDQQFKGEWEVIVVDNGSTDQSQDVVRSFTDRLPGLQLLVAREKQCVAYSRNVGVSASAGRAIVFLDQDDEAAPGYLEAMSAGLAKYPFVAARLDHQTLNETWAAQSLLPWQSDRLQNRFGFLPYANGGSLGILRSAFDLTDGFDESLAHSDDVAFCWSLALAGVMLTLVPEAVLRYRHRTTPRRYLRQEWISGIDDVTLYRLFGQSGMPRPTPGFGYSNSFHFALRAFKVRSRQQGLLWLGELAVRLGRVEGWRRDRQGSKQA